MSEVTLTVSSMYIISHLVKTEGFEMLGVWGQNILLQPVQGHAEELNHLESNVLP